MSNALSRFRIHFIRGSIHQPGAPAIEAYAVEAEDVRHAIEQFEAEGAHDGASVISVALDRRCELAGDLQRDGDGAGYSLRSDAQTAWLTVDNASVAVKRTDEGVVVDVHPLGCEDADAITSCWVTGTLLAERGLASDTLLDHHRDAHLAALPA